MNESEFYMKLTLLPGFFLLPELCIKRCTMHGSVVFGASRTEVRALMSVKPCSRMTPFQALRSKFPDQLGHIRQVGLMPFLIQGP